MDYSTLLVVNKYSYSRSIAYTAEYARQSLVQSKESSIQYVLGDLDSRVVNLTVQGFNLYHRQAC